MNHHQPATGRGDGRAYAQGRVTARDTAREVLARTLRQIENDAAGIVAPGPFEALSDMAQCMWLDQAGRLLASPALDAVVAERVAALAEDEALIARLYRESRGSRSLGDIRMVLRALAAALTERSQS